MPPSPQEKVFRQQYRPAGIGFIAVRADHAYLTRLVPESIRKEHFMDEPIFSGRVKEPDKYVLAAVQQARSRCKA